MAINNELDKRMKENYEQIPKTRLMRRTPVIIRVDGKAFHTFTKGFRRPFDEVLIKSMQGTTKYLCENVQGCVLGYTQSDEISLVLVDYQKLNSDGWFDYEVQKMCSVIASMATMIFNKLFYQNVTMFNLEIEDAPTDENLKLSKAYQKAIDAGAMFDARVFNVPKEEVTNYIYSRQLDASCNSVQMVGQANFSHKELKGKSRSNIQDMLVEQKGINWNDYPTYQKRGSCCKKEEYLVGDTLRTRWVVDRDIPIFKGDSREYIERLIYIE